MAERSLRVRLGLFMGASLIALAGLAFKARRNLRASAVPASEDIIDARPVGGHSWVAYGWERR